LDDHDGWAEDEMADEVIRSKIREIELTDSWGNVSEQFKELVRAAQVKKINWRNHIRRFGGNLIWKHKEMTLKRPNRRTGLLHPGYKRNHTDTLLVCLDNSMSTQALTPEFLGVINGMTDFMPIDLVQFDADITDGPKQFKKKTNHTCVGGGGTNFQPVIDLMDKRRYRGAVILTDGEASECTRPKKTRVLWVLPKGKKPPVEWGTRVHLDAYV
jgi:predicted metal-dependent peptidase